MKHFKNLLCMLALCASASFCSEQKNEQQPVATGQANGVDYNAQAKVLFEKAITLWFKVQAKYRSLLAESYPNKPLDFIVETLYSEQQSLLGEPLMLKHNALPEKQLTKDEYDQFEKKIKEKIERLQRVLKMLDELIKWQNRKSFLVRKGFGIGLMSLVFFLLCGHKLHPLMNYALLAGVGVGMGYSAHASSGFLAYAGK